MNIYLSHARKDGGLALELTQRLEDEGLHVLYPEAEIAPGDNWAKKIGKALQNSEFMVFLLTPGAMDADGVRNDLEFALSSRKFEGRVFSVIVTSVFQAGKDVPWILLKLPHQQVESAKQLGEVAREIAAQCIAGEASSSHA